MIKSYPPRYRILTVFTWNCELFYVILFCTLEKFVVSQKTFVYVSQYYTQTYSYTYPTSNNVLVFFVSHFVWQKVCVYALFKEIIPKVVANSAKADLTCVLDIKGWYPPSAWDMIYIINKTKNSFYEMKWKGNKLLNILYFMQNFWLGQHGLMCINSKEPVKTKSFASFEWSNNYLRPIVRKICKFCLNEL